MVLYGLVEILKLNSKALMNGRGYGVRNGRGYGAVGSKDDCAAIVKVQRHCAYIVRSDVNRVNE